LRELRDKPPGARIPKLVIQRGTLADELRKAKDTSKLMILVPPFRFEVHDFARGIGRRNFKPAARGAILGANIG
jgi:hypothetical protein